MRFWWPTLCKRPLKLNRTNQQARPVPSVAVLASHANLAEPREVIDVILFNIRTRIIADGPFKEVIFQFRRLDPLRRPNRIKRASTVAPQANMNAKTGVSFFKL